MKETFEVRLKHLAGYRFEVDFQLPQDTRWVTDEGPPLGSAAGPAPSGLVAAAAANCLSASLLLCLQKMKVPVDGLSAVVQGRIARNERGRWRLAGLKVRLEVETSADEAEVDRARAIFRDYCIVTESLQTGFPVESEVVVVAPSQRSLQEVSS